MDKLNGTFNILNISLIAIIIVASAIIFALTTLKLNMNFQQTDNKLTSIEKKLAYIEDRIKVKTRKNLNEKQTHKDKDEVLRLSDIIESIQPRLDYGLRMLIAKTILETSKKHNIDPLLITALIYEESNFRPLVQSKAGAVGLMQIRFSVWKEHFILKNNGVSAKDKLFWIENNINCGVKILKKYIDEAKGDIVVALNRYHTGSSKLNCKKYEVRYVNKIMLRYYKLQQQRRLSSYEAN